MSSPTPPPDPCVAVAKPEAPSDHGFAGLADFGPDLFHVQDPGLGTVLGGGGTGRAPDPSVFRALPLYPSRRHGVYAEVPRPPLLDDDVTDAALAEEVLKAYRAVVGHTTGKPCRVLGRRGQLGKYRERPMLIAAAHVMREQNIPPHEWIQWACRQWEAKSAPGQAPPLRYVFEPSSITSRLDFYAEAHEKLGGRAIFGPALLDLVGRHTHAASAVRSASTFPDAQAIVESILPDSEYQRLVRTAQAEAAQVEQRLRESLKRGEYIWEAA